MAEEQKKDEKKEDLNYKGNTTTQQLRFLGVLVFHIQQQQIG